MTRAEELALIAEHVAKHGVTRPTGPLLSDVRQLENVGQALAWARANGVYVTHHKGGRLSIQGSRPVPKGRFVAYINGMRARSLGMAVRSDASMLPGTRT